MRRHVIVYTKDDTTGEMGFRLKLMPRLDNGEPECGDGALIAHDLLEHLRGPREIGGIADEIIALGAAWFVRGQHGRISDTYNHHKDEEHIAVDIARFAEMWEHEYFPAAVEHLRADSRAEESLREIYNIAHRDWGKNVNYRAASVEEHAEIVREANAGYWPHVMPYLRYGFAKAARKYRDRDMSGLFWRVAKAVDKAKVWAEYDGQEFIIHLDVARETVLVTNEQDLHIVE